MLSCKEVTRLLSDGQDRALGLGERLRLRLHLAMCQGCANYRDQMSFLRRACGGYAGRVLGGRDPSGDAEGKAGEP